MQNTHKTILNAKLRYLQCVSTGDTAVMLQDVNKMESVVQPPPGEYSLYVGLYECAAILSPFFDILGIELDLFGILFFTHQHQNNLLGYQIYQSLQNLIFLVPKFHFSLDIFGSNFHRPAAHPHQFSDRVAPHPPGSLSDANTSKTTLSARMLCLHCINNGDITVSSTEQTTKKQCLMQDCGISTVNALETVFTLSTSPRSMTCKYLSAYGSL